MKPVTHFFCWAGAACILAGLGMGYHGTPWWGLVLVWGGVLILAGAIYEHGGGR